MLPDSSCFETYHAHQWLIILQIMCSLLPQIIVPLLIGFVHVTHALEGHQLPIINYSLPVDSDVVCFYGKFAASLRFRYPMKNGEFGNVYFPVDNTFNYTGACALDSRTQVLEITNKNLSLNIKMVFTDDDTKYSISSISITAFIQPSNFPNVDGNSTGIKIFDGNTTYIAFPKNHSLMCNSNSSIVIPVQVKQSLQQDLKAVISFSKLHIQPFYGNRTFDGFGVVSLCETDRKNSNVVPLTVGIILIVLVIIVFVSYCIGRHRHRSGYETV